MSSGSTTLPFDFDMTAPPLSTIPCVSSRLNGSSKLTSPTSRSTRRAPVPLARDAPILEAVLDFTLAAAPLLGIAGHAGAHRRRFLSAVVTGVDEPAVVRGRLRHAIGGRRVVAVADDDADRQVV